MRAATLELIGANGLAECYVRPIAFYGYGELGVHPRSNPVDVVIMSWPWGTYLGEEALTQGISAKVSSWKRVGPNTIPHVSKATGIYLNSMLAVIEATNAGYEEAILLTDEGHVARRLRREHLRRQGRDHLDAAPLDVDPPGDHASERDGDRPGARLRGAREARSSAPISTSRTRSS